MAGTQGYDPAVALCSSELLLRCSYRDLSLTAEPVSVKRSSHSRAVCEGESKYLST